MIVTLTKHENITKRFNNNNKQQQQQIVYSWEKNKQRTAKQQIWNFENEILVFHLKCCLQNISVLQ